MIVTEQAKFFATFVKNAKPGEPLSQQKVLRSVARSNNIAMPIGFRAHWDHVRMYRIS